MKNKKGKKGGKKIVTPQWLAIDLFHCNFLVHLHPIVYLNTKIIILTSALITNVLVQNKI